MKRINVNKLYENKTLNFILDDLISNELTPNTPIRYNPDLINPPDLTVTKLEINDKSVLKAIEKILKYANHDFQNAQYRAGINENNEIFFGLLEDVEGYGFYEGYQFQNPDVEIDTDDLVNIIMIYRTIEDSDEVEYVSTISDSDSIDEWGERVKKLIIEDFVHQDDAERIAGAMLEKYKVARTKFEINALRIEDEPYPIGFYGLNSRYAEYAIKISDFENLAAWDKHVSVTTITRSDEQVLSRKFSFKTVQANGSSGEYMEFTIDEAVYFPSTISMYVNQNVAGEYFSITMYDEDGNAETAIDVGLLLTESGDFIMTEDDRYIEITQINFRVDILGDFVKIERAVNILDNIKRVRIVFTAAIDVTVFFDRLDILADLWKSENLCIDEIVYSLEKGNMKAKAVFGDKTANIVDDIKKIDDKTVDLASIFEKQ